jgi:hypothetical protein
VTAGWDAGMSCEEGSADVVGTERRDIVACKVSSPRKSLAWRSNSFLSHC